MPLHRWIEAIIVAFIFHHLIYAVFGESVGGFVLTLFTDLLIFFVAYNLSPRHL